MQNNWWRCKNFEKKKIKIQGNHFNLDEIDKKLFDSFLSSVEKV